MSLSVQESQVAESSESDVWSLEDPTAAAAAVWEEQEHRDDHQVCLYEKKRLRSHWKSGIQDLISEISDHLVFREMEVRLKSKLHFLTAAENSALSSILKMENGYFKL